jgi:cytochrome c oxidase assembly protein subunit 15
MNNESAKFLRNSNMLFIAVLLYQVVLGIMQARLGLPIALVALHMLGASVLASMLTLQLLINRNVFRVK